MYRNHSLFVSLLLVACSVVPAPADYAQAPRAVAPRLDVIQGLPMAFEPNVGQVDARASFVARGRGYTVFVSDGAATLSLGSESLRLHFEGSKSGARAVVERELPGKVNYLMGIDPSKWHRNVPTYGAVRLVGIYDGIDAVLHGHHQSLEYDFVVAPGADPSQIRVRFEGQRSVESGDNGEIVLKLASGEIHQRPAYIYQDGRSGRREVLSRCVADIDGVFRFELDSYDRTRPLVIDPVLDYSVFLGGSSSSDEAAGIAVDATGAAIVTGSTLASDFPTTPGAFDTSYNSIPDSNNFNANFDVFVAKVSADGQTLLYSTYLGGSVSDRAAAVDVDGAGNAYVVGMTLSTDYPTTPGVFHTTFGGIWDAFVTKVSADGSSLAYSTFLGGLAGDFAESVAVRPDGTVVVAGGTYSADYPTTPGAYDTSLADFPDGFVTKLNASGTGLAFSTFLGASRSDTCYAVALDSAGAVYVTGGTNSLDFPATPGAYDTTIGSDFTEDAFVAKLDATGSSLLWASYLGGIENDIVESIAVDSAGTPVVVGTTVSDDFPATPGAFSGTTLAGGNGFVTRFAADGASLAYSSRFGGGQADVFTGVAVDAVGGAFVTGWTSSADFPTTEGAYDRTFAGSNYDAVVFQLSADGSALVLSTFLGGAGFEEACGIDRGADDSLYVTGYTGSSDFPTTDGAVIDRYRGNADVFVTRLSADASELVASTYLAGAHSPAYGVFDDAFAMTVDSSGAVYLAGSTSAATFPTTPGAYEPDWPAGDVGSNAFVTKLSADGNSLVFSTFLGGTRWEDANAMALGAGGEVFVGGVTLSSDFPVTPGAFDTTPGLDLPFQSNSDAFVSKLSADGSSLVYSTFLEGSLGSEWVSGVEARPDGTVVVAGSTSSIDFPTTQGAFDRDYNGGQYDAFAASLDPAGAVLVYSTFIGGADQDELRALEIDAVGAAYVTGRTASFNFPTTAGAFDSTNGDGQLGLDGFVVKVAPTGASLVYSTYLGGGESDDLFDVAVDELGRAAVTGQTQSADYPTTPGAFDSSLTDGSDGAVTVLSADGSSLIGSTFLGEAGNEVVNGIALAGDGRIYMTGATFDGDFPTTPGAFDRTFNDVGLYGGDAFVAVLSPDLGALEYSTYLGGGSQDGGSQIKVDATGAAVVSGGTRSNDFATGGFGVRDRFNIFVARLTPVPFFGPETPGVYLSVDGGWFIKNANAPGAADAVFTYGTGGKAVPLAGDWDGDGDDTPAVFDPESSVFFLRNGEGPGDASIVFGFGAGGAGIIPLSGDWDGDGVDTVGLFITATGTVFLRNEHAPGGADATFTFGPGGAGFVPLTGDWNGDGVDTIGLYAPATGAFFLRNENASGAADLVFAYGPPGLSPVAGDWNGDGVETIGVYDKSTATWFLRNSNSPGAADQAFGFGPAEAVPLTGDWDGV